MDILIKILRVLFGPMGNTSIPTDTGVWEDQRTEEAKSFDWLHEEANAEAEAPLWQENAPYTRFAPRNQGSSLSCVANGGAIALESNEVSENGSSEQFSHKDIYFRRANSPHGGMALFDLLRILREGGAYERQVPGMGKGESVMNALYAVTDEIKRTRSTHAAGSTFTFKKPYSMDSIAQALRDGRVVVAFWFFDDAAKGSEWLCPYPRIVNRDLQLYGPTTLRHQMAIIGHTLIDEKKHLIVQDSAGIGTGYGEKRDLRFLSEDYVTNRLYEAGYAIDRKNTPAPVQTEKPGYPFARELYPNMEGDDVMALQRVLIWEKCLVLDKPTKFYGGMTKGAVKRLQEKHASQILGPSGLVRGTGNVGPATLRWLQRNYK